MLQTISKFNKLPLAALVLLLTGTLNSPKVDARNSQNLTQIPASSNIIAAAPEWKNFSDDEGKFSVLMPNGEVFDTSLPSESISLGIIKSIKMYASHDDKSAFIAGYVDFSIDISQLPSDTLLDSFLQGMLEGKSKLLSQTNIQFGQYQGKEVKIRDEEQGITYNSRFFLVGQKIYVLMVASDQTPEAKDSAKFFNSFQLVQ